MNMADSQQLRALVVDDDSTARRIGRMMLQHVGFQVSEAENGKDAVANFCDGNDYSLVLMDKEMPLMDGVEATKAIKEKGTEVKLVAVTAKENAREAFIEAGADAFLVKPLTTAKLSEVLKIFNFIN